MTRDGNHFSRSSISAPHEDRSLRRSRGHGIPLKATTHDMRVNNTYGDLLLRRKTPLV